MTLQEMFDKVWEFFVVQRQPLSVDAHTEMCRYRLGPTKRCAIGLFIPDDLYKPEMEGKTVVALLDDYPELRASFTGVLTHELTYLQCAHDTCVYENKAMKRQLKLFAKHFNLTIPRGQAQWV